MAEQSNKRSTDDIRHEIEQTRQRMGYTIDALETRLDPNRLKQEAKQTLRDQTVGRVEQFADNAGETVKGASTDVFETIKSNPLPAAIAALGLGWLFIESRNRSTSQYTNYRGTPRAGYPYPYYPSGSRQFQGQMGDQGRMGQMMDRGQEQAQQMAGAVQDKAQQVAGQVQDQAQQVAGQVQDQVGQWADAAQEGAYQVRSRFEQLMDENPLLVGAAALAIGAAIGMSLPSTSKENELFGDTSDKVKDQAQAKASDTMQKAQQVAQRAGDAAKDAAKDEAQRQNLTSS